MESSKKNRSPAPPPAEERHPLLSGFWLGFWSFLLLTVGSWFIPVPFFDLGEGIREGKVSFFKGKSPTRSFTREVAGQR